MKFTLSAPYNFEGNDFAEIELDLEKLTGRDVSAAKRAWQRGGNFSPLITVDTDFCAYLGAKAAGMPFEFVEGLPAKDYCRISQAVSNFLMD